MVVLIAMLTGIADYVALLALFAVNAAMIFLGWLMELLNPPDRARTRWLPFVLGCVVGAVAWIAIAVQIGVSADAWTCAADVRLCDLRLALRPLQQLRRQPGPAVQAGRALARLPLRRALVSLAEPRREEPARMAGVRERARALSLPATHAQLTPALAGSPWQDVSAGATGLEPATSGVTGRLFYRQVLPSVRDCPQRSHLRPPTGGARSCRPSPPAVTSVLPG